MNAELATMHRRVQGLQRQTEQAAAEFHAAVARALADGRSPTELARALGVTRARVYQWRDKGR